MAKTIIGWEKTEKAPM